MDKRQHREPNPFCDIGTMAYSNRDFYNKDFSDYNHAYFIRPVNGSNAARRKNTVGYNKFIASVQDGSCTTDYQTIIVPLKPIHVYGPHRSELLVQSISYDFTRESFYLNVYDERKNYTSFRHYITGFPKGFALRPSCFKRMLTSFLISFSTILEFLEKSIIHGYYFTRVESSEDCTYLTCPWAYNSLFWSDEKLEKCVADFTTILMIDLDIITFYPDQSHWLSLNAVEGMIIHWATVYMYESIRRYSLYSDEYLPADFDVTQSTEELPIDELEQDFTAVTTSVAKRRKTGLIKIYFHYSQCNGRTLLWRF